MLYNELDIRLSWRETPVDPNLGFLLTPPSILALSRIFVGGAEEKIRRIRDGVSSLLTPDT
jgi:hypothetical protein